MPLDKMSCHLCSSCQSALDRPQERGNSIRPPYRQEERKCHSNSVSFEDAVSEDCYICRLLWKLALHDGLVSTSIPPGNEVSLSTSLRLTGCHGDNYPKLVCTAVKRESASEIRSTTHTKISRIEIPLIYPTEIDLGTKFPTPWASDDQADEEASNPALKWITATADSERFTSVAEALLDLGRRWISDCVHNHQGCRGNGGVWYPGRLIEIRDRHDEELYDLCLVSREDLHGNGHYLTLSHRWPNKETFKWIQPPLEQLQQGFRSSILPHTFQDSIKAAYYLGFRHIWIDSLCINQTDSEDWMLHSAEMHQIYSRATCNLSATCTTDYTARMLPDPESRQKNGNQTNLRTWTTSTPVKLLDGGEWHNATDSSPLRNRGWVFQERMLSRRTIHFCKSQILWECSQLRASENWPFGIPSMESSTVDLGLSHLKQLVLSDPTTTNAEKGLDWWDIVKFYSMMHLTQETDRLIALSGVASAFAAPRYIPVSDYIAGMWRQSLEQEMFWVSAEVVQNAGELNVSDYKAPSFSWASVGRAVTRIDPPYSTKPLLKVQQITLDHQGHDKLGPLRGGHAILRGALATITCDISPGWTNGTLTAAIVNETKIKAQLYMDTSISPGEHRLFCLLLGNIEDESKWGVAALILLEPIESHQGTFRRVGLAHQLRPATEDADNAWWFIMIDRLVSEGRSDIPSLEYYPSTHEHLIKII